MAAPSVLHLGMAKLEEENHEKPCPCGKGTVTWTFCSPTAMYQRGMEGPSSLNCEACSKEWTLRRGGELRHKGDQAKSEAAYKQVNEASGALHRDVIQPVVKALYERAMAQGRKGADWYEALKPAIPASLGASVEEFKKRRGRRSLDEWIAAQVRVENVAQIASAIGLSVPLAERLRGNRLARHVVAR